ncbi:MAG: flagellar biosynthesis protein FlaG [Epsilonproteobacteria bacterium]|nr:flagellar biosynthesis protein FlaG [Campylobacterota bacterium]
MDIFSATSKQVPQATQATVDTSMNVKKTVESTKETAKTQKDQMPDAKSIKQQLNNTIKHLNEHMKSLDTNVTFGFNDKIDILFVNVMERSTGKIIRRIPTEEAMKLSEKMKEIVGMIFDKKG